MKLSNENLDSNREEQSLLELIGKDRTNIENIKFLTHYELSKEKDNPLVHLTYDIQKFMLQLRLDNPLIETTIDEDGGFSNFLFRLKNSKILNSVNILKYITTDIPSELKSISDGTKIYIIKFFSALKEEVLEKDVEDLVDNGELVILENEKYIKLVYNDRDSIEKYWSEDIYKAMFSLKKKGFYMGLNDPDKKANMEALKEYVNDETVFLFARNPVTIDNLKNVTMVQIQMRTLPTNLNFLLKKKFKKFQNKVPKPINIHNRYKIKDDPNNPRDTMGQNALVIDNIDPKIDKIRMPEWKF